MPNDGNETFDMEHLLKLAEEKKYRLLKEELVELNEVDIASFIEELDSERTVIVFRMLTKALATEVFAELPVDKQSHIINSITDKELSLRSWMSSMWMMPLTWWKNSQRRWSAVFYRTRSRRRESSSTSS